MSLGGLTEQPAVDMAHSVDPAVHLVVVEGLAHGASHLVQRSLDAQPEAVAVHLMDVSVDSSLGAHDHLWGTRGGRSRGGGGYGNWGSDGGCSSGRSRHRRTRGSSGRSRDWRTRGGRGRGGNWNLWGCLATSRGSNRGLVGSDFFHGRSGLLSRDGLQWGRREGSGALGLERRGGTGRCGSDDAGRWAGIQFGHERWCRSGGSCRADLGSGQIRGTILGTVRGSIHGLICGRIHSLLSRNFPILLGGQLSGTCGGLNWRCVREASGHHSRKLREFGDLSANWKASARLGLKDVSRATAALDRLVEQAHEVAARETSVITIEGALPRSFHPLLTVFRISHVAHPGGTVDRGGSHRSGGAQKAQGKEYL